MATAVTTQQRRAAELTVIARQQRSLWRDALHRLLRNRAAIVGMVVIAFFAFVAIFASVPAPYDPNGLNGGVKNQLLEPIWTKPFGGQDTDPAFLLGTDALSRDILSRLMYGARVSMIVGVVPVSVIFVIGATIGMVSGYLGGWVDNLLMRVTDVVYAFPDLLFVIIIVATLRDSDIGDLLDGLVLTFVALAVVNWVGLARLIRGQVMSLKHREFIEAARCIGVPPTRIVLKHLFPNVLAPVIVSLAFAIPGAMLTEATVAFLGSGVRPPTP